MCSYGPTNVPRNNAPGVVPGNVPGDVPGNVPGNVDLLIKRGTTGCSSISLL